MGNIELPAGCYAVIFTSRKKPNADGYDEMSKKMLELAAQQAGFLGVESARGADGFGITISYWKSLEDIKRWKGHAEHREAQRRGREDWYAEFNVLITIVR